MTKRQRRKFQKKKQREARIRQRRHRQKYLTVQRRSMFSDYPLPPSYVMTGLLEAIMVLAVMHHRAARR